MCGNTCRWCAVCSPVYSPIFAYSYACRKVWHRCLCYTVLHTLVLCYQIAHAKGEHWSKLSIFKRVSKCWLTISLHLPPSCCVELACLLCWASIYGIAQRQLDTRTRATGWTLSGEDYIMHSIFERAPVTFVHTSDKLSGVCTHKCYTHFEWIFKWKLQITILIVYTRWTYEYYLCMF